MLGVLLLFKISRNLIEFKPFKASEEMFELKCPLGVVRKLDKYIN